MATYERTLIIPRSLEETFEFVSHFQNAAHWDPRTYSAITTTDEPIRVGTQFVLTGGLLRRDTLERLHLPVRLAGMPLPYNVVAFEPPNEFILQGESALVRYRDRLTFSRQGESTSLNYFAELDLKGPLAILDRLLQGAFTRIGDDATSGLSAAVVELA